MLSYWLRAIRIRFLLASVIAVSLGLAVTWWHSGTIDIFQAALTMAGVIALHASVDLLNDYWDFKRGIDTRTKRTGMSFFLLNFLVFSVLSVPGNPCEIIQ